jgi:hypothetical protein
VRLAYASATDISGIQDDEPVPSGDDAAATDTPPEPIE